MKNTLLLGLAFSLLATGCHKSADTQTTTPGSAGTSPATTTATTPDAQAAPAPDSAAAATAVAEPLDLKPFESMRVENFPRMTTTAWKDVIGGAQTFGNVQVQIDGVIGLFGTLGASIGFPKQAMGIPVGRKFAALYIYQSAYNQSPEGAVITHVVYHYASGVTANNEIRYGADVRDWYQKPGERYSGTTNPKSKIVWRIPNGMITAPDNYVRFFMTEYANPRPDDEVTSFDLVSANAGAGSFILAMSTGPSGIFKPE